MQTANDVHGLRDTIKHSFWSVKVLSVDATHVMKGVFLKTSYKIHQHHYYLSIVTLRHQRGDGRVS